MKRIVISCAAITLIFAVLTQPAPAQQPPASTTTVPQTVVPPHYTPFVEGKWARSPKGQLIAFVRVPDRGPTELWVRHTRDGSLNLLRRGFLGIGTASVRQVRVGWKGPLIRLQTADQLSYIDLRGRLVSPPRRGTEASGGGSAGSVGAAGRAIADRT